MNPRRALALALSAALPLGLAGAPLAAEPEPAAPAAAAPKTARPADPGPAAAAPAPPPTVSDATAADAPDLAAVRDAVAAYRRGDVAAGDAIRDRTTLPGGRALLDLAALRAGGPANTFDRLAAFATEYPDFPGQAWLRRRGEDALLAERRPPAAVIAFFARERPQTPAGKLALAIALRSEGLAEDAAGLVRDAWRQDTFGRELELRILNAFPDTLTVADHRFRMERLLLRENWEAAGRAAGYAGSGFDALVKARRAVDGRARNAEKLMAAVPAELKGDSSVLFSRTQFLRRADKAADAARAVSDGSRDPDVLADGDAWWTERRLVARKLLDAGDAKAAYAVAAGHAAATPDRRVEAEFLAGWIALRFLADPAAGRRHFDRAATVAATPTARARAAYWQGRAAEAIGGSGEARTFFATAATVPTSYYGQLAAVRLGQPLAALRPAADPDSPARQAAARRPMVEALALAYRAGLRDLAFPLAVEFGRAGQDVAELETVAEIALDNRDARAALVVGKSALQRGLPLDEAAFPVIGIPAYEATATPVEAAMVHAIARQESAFDPAAGSGAGARGLMQLMPATAQATARRLGVDYQPELLNDAAYNARIGSAHLGDLMADWKGSLILTFASYNAGPGNARKWIAAYGDPRDPAVDAVDWVERIPFAETRNYVQRVMENLLVYRRRLEKERTSAAAPPPAATAAAPARAATAEAAAPATGSVR